MIPKAELRRTLRARLAGLDAGSAAQKSAAICLQIARSPQWRAARTVGFFSPMADEPDVDLLWAVLEEGGVRRVACYPRAQGDGLVFLRVESREGLLESVRWNLLEPPHRDEHVAPVADLDLILVPGLAFTRDGHRMGRGKGYYDRFLASAELRAATFGVCFAEQIVAHVPMEAHDRPVTRVFWA